MHNRCCACAYQLLCKRTTAVVRPKILTVSTTYPISFNNLFYLFQQHILSLSATYPISSSNITDIYQRQEEGESETYDTSSSSQYKSLMFCFSEYYYNHKATEASFKSTACALRVPFPFITTTHFPKNALRCESVKRSKEV